MFYAIDCEQNESNNELMCEDRRIIHVLTWVLSW